MNQYGDLKRELLPTKDEQVGHTDPVAHANPLEEPLNDYNRYSIQFDPLDEEAEQAEAVNEPRMSKKDMFIYAVIAVVVLLLLYLITKRFGHKAFKLLKDILDFLIHSHSLLSYLVLILFHFIFGWILFMPGHSTFNILQAFLMKSFFKPWVLSTIGSTLASMTIFLIIKTYFRMQIVDKFKNKILFRIVYIEVKKRPVQMGILFNLLFIPTNVKNYLMALTSISFQQYAFVIVLVHAFYCALFAFVGYSMKDIDSFFKEESFFEKTSAQQMQTVMTYFLLLLTVVLMVIFGVVAKRKYAEMETEHRRHAEVARDRVRELEKVGGPRQAV